jgi:transaldolase / glucose-6-phosphate isomerase
VPVIEKDVAAKTSSPLDNLRRFGQSVWLDYIRRSFITSGELRTLIAGGLSGVTSNPSIFEKAILGSTDYADALASLQTKSDRDAKARYEALAIRDVQDAAEALRDVYESTKYRDGYVSLEVSPYLARDTPKTIEEAKALWDAVARPNAMIKIPGTREGIAAVPHLIAEGININVTLLFSQETYQRVAEAYISGLEQRATRGGDLRRVASVASFFVSRIDAAIESIVTERLERTSDPRERRQLSSLLGKVAIANARLAYQRYQSLFATQRWKSLAAKGAQTQRLLWASTGTKNPSYSDVLYVEELIGPETVNTLPPATFHAYRDHGRAWASLTDDLDSAAYTMDTAARLGISMADVSAKLTEEGVRLFEEAFAKLLIAVEGAAKSRVVPEIGRQTYLVPTSLGSRIQSVLDEWRAGGKVSRLWRRDSSLWTGADESRWLAWLGVAEDEMVHVGSLQHISEAVKNGPFTKAVLLGMGGSSLFPEVLRMTFGKIAGFPELLVLDSTDPAQIRAVQDAVDLKKTLFIVSSKSGSTLEPNILKEHFFTQVSSAVGEKDAGRRFVAVTDPASSLQQVAETDGFRQVFCGVPGIGGRYSALSNFGMVPAAIMGLETEQFLDRTQEMIEACAPSVPVDENPGVVLGIILGVAAAHGLDKLTIVMSPGISALGIWLEQLLAESTGKQGKGIIPIDRETLGPPEVYGNDRIFAYIRLETAPDPRQDSQIDALARAGLPVIRISVRDSHDLGQEIFRWEIATAVAGSVLGINPFDQPDVEASKRATRALTDEYEKSGSLPADTPIFQDGGLTLFGNPKTYGELSGAVGDSPSLAAYIRVYLNGIRPNDYFAFLAYLEMNDSNDRALQEMRSAIRNRKRVATCVEFGPRFLHSTGQLYKGGPNSGVFLQLTCKDVADIQVPGRRFSFGIVKAAQARGDFEVLAELNRRALRVDLGSDVSSGLARLRDAVQGALL